MLHQIMPSAPAEISQTQIQIAVDTWDLSQLLECCSWSTGFEERVWGVLVETAAGGGHHTGFSQPGGEGEIEEVLARLTVNVRAAGGFFTGDLPALVMLHHDIAEEFITSADVESAREDYAQRSAKWCTISEMEALTGRVLPT